jgi:basic amino acid/polyamine antiporter, APA family
MALFWVLAITLAGFALVRKYSLIPILGVVSCLYLMAQETHVVWMRFLIWLVVGLLIYFLYSYHHSKLANQKEAING